MHFNDTEIFGAINNELIRQQNQIELIASENIVSPAVLKAQGSILTNKYAEGYAGKRYYHGCEYVDEVETIAIERLKRLFGVQFANVQPHSGAQANQAVFLALLNPGDTVLGMDLSAGGHLTHGCKVNMSGKWFNIVSYGVDDTTHLIDYDEVETKALEHKPKLIIAGASAYPRFIDFHRFKKIADKVGAYLMVDMAHYAGLIAGGVYPTPVPFADVITSTTHKTLRGTRGSIIITNREDMAKKINSAVFPGLQGGPLLHAIAGKAVAFGEALQPEFKDYAFQIVKNAKALGEVLHEGGIKLLTDGTDCHMLLLDLRPIGITGKDAADVLEQAHLTCNKNGIPKDPQPPAITSGIRVGTPACTTRGFKEEEFREVGRLMLSVLKAAAKGDAQSAIEEAKTKAIALCKRFPIYENLA
ncbi:MAG: serine hydroxymethyltransferase [Pseudomonadota bacterium]|nr:serine hydroxymethyltransferase [Alphaproteobacteria bacterium]